MDRSRRPAAVGQCGHHEVRAVHTVTVREDPGAARLERHKVNIDSPFYYLDSDASGRPRSFFYRLAALSVTTSQYFPVISVTTF